MELIFNGLVYMAKTFWLAILAIAVASAVIDKVRR